MAYQKITSEILSLIRETTSLIIKVQQANDLIRQDSSKTKDVLLSYQKLFKEWTQICLAILAKNELVIEAHEFINYPGSAMAIDGFNMELNAMLNHLKYGNHILITTAKEIERKQNKEIVILSVDDFDNFEKIKQIKSSEVLGYEKDCFLEDDIENAVLVALEEPYKEPDSGAETRDLFTDRVIYAGKRLATVFAFKGRGEKGELTIDKSGSKGNQLLKLAKNNSAQCFIVQHTNKINPDVREALIDHVLQNTKMSKIYFCFIDGVDTARLLKSLGKDLDILKNRGVSEAPK